MREQQSLLRFSLRKDTPRTFRGFSNSLERQPLILTASSRSYHLWFRFHFPFHLFYPFKKKKNSLHFRDSSEISAKNWPYRSWGLTFSLVSWEVICELSGCPAWYVSLGNWGPWVTLARLVVWFTVVVMWTLCWGWRQVLSFSWNLSTWRLFSGGNLSWWPLGWIPSARERKRTGAADSERKWLRKSTHLHTT